MTDYDPTDEPEPPDVAADGITFTLTPAQLVVGADRNGPVRLVDLVVERAAHLLVAQADQAAYRSLRDQVTAEMKASIRGELDKLVAEALAGAVQPTNQWGEARGEPTTLREVILKDVAAWLNEARPTTGSRRDQLSPFRRMLEEEIEKAVKGDLADVMAKARETVKAKIQVVATEQLGSVLVKALG
jgi:hypothetical protein